MVALIWANVKIDSPSGPAKLVGNPKGVDNSTRENRTVVVMGQEGGRGMESEFRGSRCQLLQSR